MISERVPDGVIDALEAIQVEVQESEHAALAPCLGQGLGEVILQQRPVGEIGQSVVVGQVPYSILRPLALLYV